MADTLTYDIQQAGYDFDQYDEKGTATYELFVQAFREFPWAQQVGKSNGGSEATISVKNHSKNVDLWVSVIEHQTGFDYVVGVVYLKEKPPLFGIGKPKKVRWVEVYISQEAEIVERLFRLFFDGDHTATFKLLRTQLKYDETEARE